METRSQSKVSIASVTSLADYPESDPFSDPELQAIFSEGIVVREVRTGQIVSDGRLRDAPLERVHPLSFKDGLQSRLETTLSTFDSEATRKQFLETQAREDGIFTKVMSELCPQTQPTHILDAITTKFSKDKPVVVHLCGKVFSIPRIESKHLPEARTALSAYLDRLCEVIQANLELQNQRLNKPETLQHLNCILHERAKTVSARQPRLSVTLQILSALVLEQAAHCSNQRAITSLRTASLSDDLTTGGAFIRMDDTQTTIAHRSDTMIHDNTYSAAPNIVYNLTLKQMRWIVTYILDPCPGVRTEAKINLLSSLRDNVRADAALNPLAVLQRACAEHFLTREEILHLIFRDERANTRCPTCKRHIAFLGPHISHQACPILPWLHNHFQIDLTTEGATAPSLLYLRPATAAYARELLAMDTTFKQTPFVASTAHDYSIYKMDAKGQPSRIAFQGSKVVRMTPQANR
ncbi:hypothetical protein [Wuhan cricket virus 2]|uniref:hypothetical protein n=1 Tax=Wuhan cricket virus 2 TaxID=1923697 RepID=UPI00090A7679|nr:hypothetical protein [Wuhan cricket virus 2]APG78324.1 hypothetical protein [Wuhan cricket virus 2]APG78359.1 hypothetical protein [Wuhan cricket virus 2]